MANLPLDYVERQLLGFVRSYACVQESGTNDEQVKVLRDICSAMARLLGQLLELDGRWNRYWWVDDVLPSSAKNPTLGRNLSSHQLSLDGLLIYGQRGSSRQWVEPCWALFSDDGCVFSYQICCGDASRRMGTISYAERHKLGGRALPKRWEFSFSKAAFT